MKSHVVFGCLTVVLTIALCASAMAESIIPVVYLDMENETTGLNNKGSGGSTYNATLTAGTLSGINPASWETVTDAYSTSRYGISINPGMTTSQADKGTTGGTLSEAGNYIKIPYTLPANNGAISVWYKSSATLYNYESIWTNSLDQESHEAWIYSNGRLATRAAKNGNAGATSNLYTYSGTSTCGTTNKWYNITFTWSTNLDGVTTVAQYTNGVSSGTDTINNVGTWLNAGDNVYLGGNFGNDCSLGAYGGFAVYDQALSATDALYIYTNGVTAAPEPGTMAMIGAGMAGIFAYSWQRRRRK